jgi:hypothetical protein
MSPDHGNQSRAKTVSTSGRPKDCPASSPTYSRFAGPFAWSGRYAPASVNGTISGNIGRSTRASRLPAEPHPWVRHVTRQVDSVRGAFIDRWDIHFPDELGWKVESFPLALGLDSGRLTLVKEHDAWASCWLHYGRNLITFDASAESFDSTRREVRRSETAPWRHSRHIEKGRSEQRRLFPRGLCARF